MAPLGRFQGQGEPLLGGPRQTARAQIALNRADILLRMTVGQGVYSTFFGEGK